MLMREWLAWWAHLSAITAEERLGAHTVALLADSGWKVNDRDDVLASWRALAQGASVMVYDWLAPNEAPGVTAADFTPGALRRNARRVWSWLRSHLGQQVSY